MKEKALGFGTLLSSIGISACWTLPLLAASLGLGSAGLGTIIEPWRPYLIGFAAIFLSVGFYFTYTKSPTRANKIFLWLAAGLFSVSLVFPYVLAAFNAPAAEAHVSVVSEDTKLVVVHVEGMTWPVGWPPRAAKALQTLPGVRKVQVKYETKEATLTVDSNVTLTDGDVKKALDQINYDGHIKNQ